MSTIPLLDKSGRTVAEAIVSAEDGYLDRFTWRLHATGYACRWERPGGRAGRLLTVFMHRVIVNAPERLVVDHLDRNRLNNVRSNLRVCTRAENALNKSPYRNGQSSVPGVYPITLESGAIRWRAQVKWRRQRFDLGRFLTESEAADAVAAKRIELAGGR